MFQESDYKPTTFLAYALYFSLVGAGIFGTYKMTDYFLNHSSKSLNSSPIPVQAADGGTIDDRFTEDVSLEK